MLSGLNTDKLSACPECDLLIDSSQQVKEGYVCECPRCRYIIEHPSRLSIRNNFLCVIAGLIFYFPAMMLPIMKLTMLGNTEEMSIFNCLQTLFQTGNPGIALLFLLTLILVPLAKMILIIFITIRIYYKAKTQYLALSFKWYSYLNSWGMLDIFMLGILVSAIKLRSDAEFEPGLGLYAFIILLLSSALQTQLLNHKLIWTLIERHGK